MCRPVRKGKLLSSKQLIKYDLTLGDNFQLSDRMCVSPSQTSEPEQLYTRFARL